MPREEGLLKAVGFRDWGLESQWAFDRGGSGVEVACVSWETYDDAEMKIEYHVERNERTVDAHVICAGR